MDFGLANDPAQATRITHRNVSFPDVTAYRVLRVTHRQSTPYMDSDHCLISYSAGMDDGIPRPANTLPRREKATFALRKADWPAYTSLCETLLAAASTWLDVRSGILRAAERHIPHGSRDSPKQSGQTKWNKPSPSQKQHTKHTHRLTRRQPASRRINPKCGGPKSSLTPRLRYASGSPCGKTWGFIQPKLAISQRYGGAAPSSTGIGGAPHRSSDRVCALPRQQANLLVLHFVRVSRATLPYTAAAATALHCPLVTWKWIDLSRRMNLKWPSATLRSAQPLATTTC
ncbi:hypothetical protein TcYC6_0038690 [Trypanosoma cruzi]|nr:hypothetical protein TcYC6_0038690 [Trypanosoma cruzi]